MPTLRQCQWIVCAAMGLVLVVVSILHVSAGDPVEKTGDELRGRVERLVADLDSDSRQTRELAERALRDLGPRVLPLLPAPDLISGAAARDAVRRVRVVLEQQQARESAGPSRVTFHGTVSLEQLLGALSSQTANTLEYGSLPEKVRRAQVVADLDNQTFWSAINSIAGRERLLLDEGAPGTLRLRPRAATTPAPVSEAGAVKTSAGNGEIAVQSVGAFRVALRSAGVRTSFVENTPRLLRFQFGLLSEPRLRPLFLKYSAADFSAVTDAGEKLAPTSPQAKFELPAGEGTGNWNVQVDFNLPQKMAPLRSGIQGKLSVLTAASPEKFTFEGLAKTKIAGISRRKGGVAVRVDDVTVRGTPEKTTTAVVRIVVNYDTGGPAFESHRTWIFQNEAWIETPEGRRVPFAGMPQIRRQDDGGVAVEYNFVGLPQQPDVCRFVYAAPTLLVDVPIEFEFSDLPIVVTDKNKKDAAP